MTFGGKFTQFKSNTVLEDNFVLKATRDIRRGEEIFTNYLTEKEYEVIEENDKKRKLKVKQERDRKNRAAWRERAAKKKECS